MNEPIHEEKRRGLTIKIHPDYDAESPDAWGDDGLFLVGYHDRYFSVAGPKQNGYPIVTKTETQALIMGPKEAKQNGEEYPKELAKKYHVFALEAYIHSGVCLSLVEDAAPFPDRRWDVSVLGAVYVSKSEWKTRRKAAKSARGLVSAWNDRLSGNVYGYTIEDENENSVESCWGFYGDYDGEHGALKEAQNIVDSLTHHGTTDHHGQKLMTFAKS